MPLTYDDWKLATPPEYDEVPQCCPECGSTLVTIGLVCQDCGWDGYNDEPQDAYDTLEEARGER